MARKDKTPASSKIEGAGADVFELCSYNSKSISTHAG